MLDFRPIVAIAKVGNLGMVVPPLHLFLMDQTVASVKMHGPKDGHRIGGRQLGRRIDHGRPSTPGIRETDNEKQPRHRSLGDACQELRPLARWVILENVLQHDGREFLRPDPDVAEIPQDKTNARPQSPVGETGTQIDARDASTSIGQIRRRHPGATTEIENRASLEWREPVGQAGPEPTTTQDDVFFPVASSALELDAPPQIAAAARVATL